MTGDKIYKKVKAQILTLEEIKDYIAVSGGVMIHLLSPSGHQESRYGHDHTDIDLFVIDQEFFVKVEEIGFSRIRTKYDSKSDFYRYHKTVNVDGVRVKILIDAFIDFSIPYIEMPLKYKVLQPQYLISLYETKKHHPWNEPEGKPDYRDAVIVFLKTLEMKKARENLVQNVLSVLSS